MRRLRRILYTNAGELEPAHVLPVDSKRVLSEVSKRRAKTPSVQVVSLESIPIQVGRKWRSGGVDPPRQISLKGWVDFLIFKNRK